MGPCLKGLSNYCEMLNVEIVLDIVKNLISLLKEDKIKGANRFYCIHCCIKIVSSTQHVLNFEDSDLTQIIYNTILSPPTETGAQRILIESLIWMFIKQKQYSFELVASFLKRILQVSFHCDLSLMKSFLCVAKQIIQKFPRSYSLLEDTDETEAYNCKMADPSLANASTSSLLPQLGLLRTVQDPQVQSLVKNFASRSGVPDNPLNYLHN